MRDLHGVFIAGRWGYDVGQGQTVYHDVDSVHGQAFDVDDVGAVSASMMLLPHSFLLSRSQFTTSTTTILYLVYNGGNEYSRGIASL